jgi:HSP20 family protein
MATQIAQKTKEKEEVAPRPRGRALARFHEFPFFLSRIRDEFDRLLDRLSRQWPSPKDGDGWRWGVDVRDEDDTVVVQAEAPGFEAGDIDVQVSDNRLVLRASKKVETKDEKGKIQEYREQKCFESLTLPTGIDKEKVEAKYHNGVLTVRLPKTSEGKGRHIPVKST